MTVILSPSALMATGAYVFLHSRAFIERDDSSSEFSWLPCGFSLKLPDAVWPLLSDAPHTQQSLSS